jgi:DNA-binding transcriptional MerR regulator
MTTRSYLSIGDVLTLLREEFPDVTISKIRFLESQGLVNPERSPSGYRKFYEHDVERLRWVLRQQREHFLPLKVIRDRLSTDGEDLAVIADPAADLEPRVQAVAVADEPSAETANGAEAPRETESPEASRNLGGDPPADLAAHGTPLAGPVSAATMPAAQSKGGGPSASVDPSAAEPGLDAGGPPSADRPGRAADPRPAPPAARAEGAATPGARAPTPPAGGVGTSEPGGVTVAGEPFELDAGPSGASLTLHELCGASGLSATEVAAIEGFGLIRSMDVAGAVYYDEEALTVARLVVEFGRFGIEPRHLRLYRNAVDREVGLVEQVVTPFLRQRSPEARQRAVDSATDLVRLGQGLRAALLRRELRDLLGY